MMALPAVKSETFISHPFKCLKCGRVDSEEENIGEATAAPVDKADKAD
jgi:hypothetical protein